MGDRSPPGRPLRRCAIKLVSHWTARLKKEDRPAVRSWTSLCRWARMYSQSCWAISQTCLAVENVQPSPLLCLASALHALCCLKLPTLSSSLPQVYRALVAALGEEEDAAMQLAAVASLRALVDDWCVCIPKHLLSFAACCTPCTAGRTCCLKSRQSGPLHALLLPGLLPSPSYSCPHVFREFDEAQFLEFVAPCFQQLAALLSSASEFDSQARGGSAICLGAV